jgi:hypothetical protein
MVFQRVLTLKNLLFIRNKRKTRKKQFIKNKFSHLASDNMPIPVKHQKLLDLRYRNILCR